MSPKIGLAFDVRPYAANSLRPLDRVRMAVNVVESQGMRVELDGSHWVGRNLTTGRWRCESPYHPRRVSPLGAVCIVLQPEPTGESFGVVEAGAVLALDVSLGWVDGFADGFAGEARAVYLDGITRALYLDGLRAGHVLFTELTVECSACGARNYRRDPGGCAGCP